LLRSNPSADAPSVYHFHISTTVNHRPNRSDLTTPAHNKQARSKKKGRGARRVSTLTMSMGWMTQVASIPEAPPLTKGLTVFQTPAVAACGSCFASAISPYFRIRAGRSVMGSLGSGSGGGEAKANEARKDGGRPRSRGCRCALRAVKLTRQNNF
jgi:hypothetical protein